RGGSVGSVGPAGAWAAVPGARPSSRREEVRRAVFIGGEGEGRRASEGPVYRGRHAAGGPAGEPAGRRSGLLEGDFLPACPRNGARRTVHVFGVFLLQEGCHLSAVPSLCLPTRS